MYIVGGACAFFVLAMGLAGFTSNIVQFGLEQLLEAPSKNIKMKGCITVQGRNVFNDLVYVFVFFLRFGHPYVPSFFYLATLIVLFVSLTVIKSLVQSLSMERK